MKRNIVQTKFPFCQWELILDCNMECVGCQARTKIKAGYQHPSVGLVLRCIDDLVCAGVEILEFIGGEVPLYDDLPVVFRYLNQIPEIKKFAVLTNGIARDALQRLKPELSVEKGGLVVSINYTPEKCEELLRAGIDTDMVKKSLAGWRVLKEFSGHGWVRVNCTVNSINTTSLAEIARRVINLGGFFSLCPLIYKRTAYDSGLIFTFRSSSVGFAPTGKDRKNVERSVSELEELRKKYSKQIIPTKAYLRLVIESCKNPIKAYPANCASLGLPYLRVSSEIGESLIDGKTAFRLRACSDLKGSNISKIVTSDLRDSDVRELLPLIYQNDPEVKKCCECEGCVWSVTHLLAPLS